MDQLTALRTITHRVRVPFGMYNLRPATAGSVPGRGAYRSSLLWGATRQDLRELGRLGLSLVIDLRTEKVANNFPDPAVPGAEHLLVDIHGTGHSTPGVRRTEADTMDAMRARYRRMVTDVGQRERIGQVLRLIGEAEGAVLFHCTDGKDRTGWIAALLQHVSGVDREAIVADYLASQPKVAHMARFRAVTDTLTGGPAKMRRNRPMNVVDASFLQAGFDTVDEEFGSLDSYLRDGLGLGESDLERLRARL